MNGARSVNLSLDDDVWEKIHTAFNDAELHLITGILAGEGVEWRIRSRRVPQLPVSHGALGAAEIYVRKVDAPMAQRILMIYRNRSSVGEA
jgi:Putative prokaryotic signal transducing protein